MSKCRLGLFYSKKLHHVGWTFIYATIQLRDTLVLFSLFCYVCLVPKVQTPVGWRLLFECQCMVSTSCHHLGCKIGGCVCGCLFEGGSWEWNVFRDMEKKAPSWWGLFICSVCHFKKIPLRLLSFHYSKQMSLSHCAVLRAATHSVSQQYSRKTHLSHIKKIQGLLSLDIREKKELFIQLNGEIGEQEKWDACVAKPFHVSLKKTNNDENAALSKFDLVLDIWRHININRWTDPQQSLTSVAGFLTKESKV